MEETAVDKLADDIRAVDGNHDLGAGALAEALIEKGWIHASSVPVVKAAPAAPLTLKDFAVDEIIEVFLPSRGDWVRGQVVEIGELGDQIHVGHEFGSTTVGTVRRVRKLA